MEHFHFSVPIATRDDRQMNRLKSFDEFEFDKEQNGEDEKFRSNDVHLRRGESRTLIFDLVSSYCVKNINVNFLQNTKKTPKGEEKEKRKETRHLNR